MELVPTPAAARRIVAATFAFTAAAAVIALGIPGLIGLGEGFALAPAMLLLAVFLPFNALFLAYIYVSRLKLTFDGTTFISKRLFATTTWMAADVAYVLDVQDFHGARSVFVVGQRRRLARVTRLWKAEDIDAFVAAHRNLGVEVWTESSTTPQALHQSDRRALSFVQSRAALLNALVVLVAVIAALSAAVALVLVS